MIDTNVIYGTLPPSWSVIKLKYLLDLYSGGTPTASDNTNYADDGICFVNISDMTGNEFIFDTKKHLSIKGLKEKNLRVLRKGTVLYSIYASIGSISELSIPSTISQAILALLPKSNELDAEYLKFNLECIKDHLSYYANGTTQFNLSAEIVREFPLLRPSTTTQNKIISILGNKVRIINSLITLQEQQIEKLKEYKQSVISKAVTKGLYPKAPMKDSGIEWIGEIPVKWVIDKIRYRFMFGKGLSITKEDLREEGIKCISYGEVHSKYPIGFDSQRDNLKCVDVTYLDSNPQSILSRGDFIFADTSEDIQGSGDFSMNEGESVFAGYHSIIVKKNDERVSNRYLQHLFFSDYWRSQIRSNVVGIKVYSISQKIIKNSWYLIPPLKEQNEICDYIDSKMTEIAPLLKNRTEKIEKLQEYKKTLIYEYITGKKQII